jgi:hypothetical protein
MNHGGSARIEIWKVEAKLYMLDGGVRNRRSLFKLTPSPIVVYEYLESVDRTNPPQPSIGRERPWDSGECHDH